MKVGALWFQMAGYFSRALPRSLAYALGIGIANGFHACDPVGRRAVTSNLRRVLEFQGVTPSEEKLKRLVCLNFQNFGKYLVDFFRFSAFSKSDIARWINMDHLDHLERAVALERGVILVTAHIGNWELGGAVIKALGHPLTAVAFPQRVGKTNELFFHQRRLRGMNVIPLGQAARGILEALRRRELVAMLADRDYTPHHDILPFFGRPTRLSIGPARIAHKTGAPIVPGFVLRQADDTYLLRFYPPLLPETGLTVMDIQLRIRDILQIEIAENPTQWFIFEDFWNPQRDHEKHIES